MEGEARHDGFVQRLDRIREIVEEGLDIDRILEIAAQAEPLEAPEPDLYRRNEQGSGLKIGVALDEAFNFYYRDNLELMELAGAQVVPFSPVHDKELPAGGRHLHRRRVSGAVRCGAVAKLVHARVHQAGA